MFSRLSSVAISPVEVHVQAQVVSYHALVIHVFPRSRSVVASPFSHTLSLSVLCSVCRLSSVVYGLSHTSQYSALCRIFSRVLVALSSCLIALALTAPHRSTIQAIRICRSVVPPGIATLGDWSIGNASIHGLHSLRDRPDLRSSTHIRISHSRSEVRGRTYAVFHNDVLLVLASHLTHTVGRGSSEPSALAMDMGMHQDMSRSHSQFARARLRIYGYFYLYLYAECQDVRIPAQWYVLRCLKYWTPPTQGPLPACVDRGNQIRDVACGVPDPGIRYCSSWTTPAWVRSNIEERWIDVVRSARLDSPRHRHLYLLQGGASRCPHVLVHATMKDYDRMPAHADMAYPCSTSPRRARCNTPRVATGVGFAGAQISTARATVQLSARAIPGIWILEAGRALGILGSGLTSRPRLSVEQPHAVCLARIAFSNTEQDRNSYFHWNVFPPH